MENREQRLNQGTTPLARRDGLVIKNVGNEMLVYDTDRQLAHCLNQNAALIWQHCDGERTIEELFDLFKTYNELNRSQIEQIILLALDQLEKSHLLEDEKPESENGLSRRQLMKVAGIVTLAAIPVISSIIAPISAEASTCLASGQGCTISAQCCSGLCSAGTCA